MQNFIKKIQCNAALSVSFSHIPERVQYIYCYNNNTEIS